MARPITPNMVMYDEDEVIKSGLTKIRPVDAPPAPVYKPPILDSGDDAKPRVWTIEEPPEDKQLQDDSVSMDDDTTKLLLDKEFDDFYEDQVHKSAGPVVFLSKVFGMLPVIWTEEEMDGECKSYFNLYTFLIFIAWVAMAVITGIRTSRITNNPAYRQALGSNITSPLTFITQPSLDTHMACMWVPSLVTLLFCVFKCRSMAEIFFGLSKSDAQLELRQKHYDKIKKKTIYWFLFMLLLLIGHSVAMYIVYSSTATFDLLIYLADLMTQASVLVLDLQFIFFSMVLCKRYRMTNKILMHITKPWHNFRNEQPSNFVLQNILQYRFDQIFQPSEESLGPEDKQALMSKRHVPLEKLIKEVDEPRVNKEEENTFILQLDIIRRLHTDLVNMTQEVDNLLGFQVMVIIAACFIHFVMFGYFFAASLIKAQFFWPYLLLSLIPAIRIFLYGQWGQVIQNQSKQSTWTMGLVSSVDGSAKLERQVMKMSVQMHHQSPTLTAAGYFNLGRSLIIKTICSAVAFTIIMVKLEELAFQRARSQTN